MAYTLPMARPFNTCWSSSLPFTKKSPGRPSATPGYQELPATCSLLLHEDELALGAVRIHLDLRHVGSLLHALSAHAGARRERDLAQRRVIRARDQLLVQLDPQRGEVHLGDRRLLVECAQGLDEHLDAGERLGAELRRVLLLLVLVD